LLITQLLLYADVTGYSQSQGYIKIRPHELGGDLLYSDNIEQMSGE